MNVVVAPAELPFAPRPRSAELVSSWLMRVAAANLVSLRELLDGFEEQYGQVLTNVPIDYAIPDAAVAALSRFCRVAPEKDSDARSSSAHSAPQSCPATPLPSGSLASLVSPLQRTSGPLRLLPLVFGPPAGDSPSLGLERGLSDPLRGSSSTPVGRLPRVWRTRPPSLSPVSILPQALSADLVAATSPQPKLVL